MFYPTELRVGNYVFCNGKPAVVQLICNPPYSQYNKLNERCIIVEVLNEPNQFNKEMSDITPIPLTPEILEKAGLTTNGNSYNNENYSFCLEQNGDKFYVEFDSKLISNGFEYLHQLQNLYFALTGEELQVML